MKLSTQTPERRISPQSQKACLAETSTLYSDTPVSLRLEIRKPIEAIAAYYLSLYFAPWQTDVLVRSIAHRAYANCYQGKWQLVQEILELEVSRPEELEDWYLAHNPFEFYGCVLPETIIVERRVRYRDSRKSINSPVRKPQRRRGYNDKGSRRLPHEDHGDPPIREEREDRRLQIAHPLIRESGRKEKPEVEELPPAASCQERSEATNVSTETERNCPESTPDSAKQAEKQESAVGKPSPFSRTSEL